MQTKLSRLTKIHSAISNCKECELWKTRTNTVPGSGSVLAKVVFIGEGPGYNEDIQGTPFVGAAGQLLDALLPLAFLKREDVFICNLVKCRTPGNRTPHVDELACCTPWLIRQVNVLNPEIIVTLGRPATNFTIGRSISITAVRGTILYTPTNRKVMAMFHPAAALYDESKMAYCEQDFVTLGQILRNDNTEVQNASVAE